MKKKVQRLDKTVVKITTIDDQKGWLDYWLKQPVVERIRALEELRKQSGYDPTERLQRSIVTIKRLPG